MNSIARTEKAFEVFQREHAALFAAVKAAFPTLANSMIDFAKAAFIAGANYEAAYLSGLDDILKAKEAA